MTSRLWILVLASLGLMACSQTVGDCWLIDEEGNDLGITIPDCNSTGPCDDRCFDNFEAVLITCRDVEGKTQRKTCEDEAVHHFEDCRGQCRRIDACLETCKENCAEKCQ